MSGRHSVALSLGSNCGDREGAVAEAEEWLTAILVGARGSDAYETAPVGSGTRPYLNAVVLGETDLSDCQLNAMLKAYETSHGRDDESRRRGDVPIDIDLVVSDGKVLRPRDFACSFFTIGYYSLTSLR